MSISLQDLLQLSQRELREIVDAGEPLPLDALEGMQYQGVDLSLPPFMNALLWKTFRKTFVRDADTGELRGWNVRMKQLGIEGPREPMRLRNGSLKTFGHYVVREAAGISFPGGWRGGHYLDYGSAGNPWWDLARLGRTPLVCVNPGDPRLLLGWEVMSFAGIWLPIPDFWALRLEGPLEEVIPPPNLRP